MYSSLLTVLKSAEADIIGLLQELERDPADDEQRSLTLRDLADYIRIEEARILGNENMREIFITIYKTHIRYLCGLDSGSGTHDGTMEDVRNQMVAAYERVKATNYRITIDV